MRLYRILIALTLAVATHSPTRVSAAQETDAAINLLDRVAQHYQNAETLHIAATITSESHNDFTIGTQRSVLSAWSASGGRMRLEGENSQGSSRFVSDGTSEWLLMPSFRQYSKQPAGTHFSSTYLSAGDMTSLSEAHNLLAESSYLGTQLRHAHFGEDEKLTVDGHTVHCKVITYGLDDFANKSRYVDKEDDTFWIDPEHLVILKHVSDTVSRSGFGNQVAPFARQHELIRTAVYTAVDIGFEPTPDLFTFVPPTDAKEVAELPNGLMNPTATKGPTAAEKTALTMVGKPLPQFFLVDSNAQSFSIARYAGHPLLIDMWATWCGPCIAELPTIGNIRKSTAQSDLKIIGIDEDNRPDLARDFLKRRGYGWDDFHYSHAVTKALPADSIPLLVLVDASGKIVYYHDGSGDAKGLAAAIAMLGPQYESVSVEK